MPVRAAARVCAPHPHAPAQLRARMTSTGNPAQVMGQGDGVEDVSIIHAPFSLFPTPFPRSEFELVQRSMPLFSSLVHAVSQDAQYLTSTLRAAAQYDDFTGKLLTVFRDTMDKRSSRGSAVSLGLHRSDYMLDEPSTSLLQVRCVSVMSVCRTAHACQRAQGTILGVANVNSSGLQVELNTIAASFGSLSTQVSALHRHLLALHPSHLPCQASQLPEQNALPGFASAIAEAHSANCAENQLPDSAVVVMVVQPGERNAYDQQWLQLTLWQEHRVRVWRKSLHDIATQGETDEHGVMRCVHARLHELRPRHLAAWHPCACQLMHPDWM